MTSKLTDIGVPMRSTAPQPGHPTAPLPGSRKPGALRKWLQTHHGYVDLRRVDQPWFWGLVLGGGSS